MSRFAMGRDQAHFEYVLRLGDNALILGQRLSQWCGKSPFVEEDIGLANTALDHIGRARMLLTHAGALEDRGRDEDDLAYKRDERAFTNLLICELPIGDFAFTTVRQFLLDAFNQHLFDRLQSSNDETLAGIAAKVVKESRYHHRHSSGWLRRLGDGTNESHQRVQETLNQLWRYTYEMFAADDVDTQVANDGIGPALEDVFQAWSSDVLAEIERATLQLPEDESRPTGGRQGLHTESMGFLLAEMQFVQRAYPGLNW